MSESRRTLLVTGLSGFVGQRLRAYLETSEWGREWELLEQAASYDLCCPDDISAMLKGRVPDAVIHLAGQTFVPEAFRNPAHTLQVNLLGTLNLLQALKGNGFQGAFLFVSSGDVYGAVAERNLPIVETLAPRPRNPYAVSKVSAELLCQQWSYVEPWRIMIARPFNHIGPGQREDFVIPSMARQMVRIRKGWQQPRLEVGDIDVTRDFLDVNDVIAAYLHLLRDGRNGEVYNVCSGAELCIRDAAMQLAQLAGVQVELVQDLARLRPSEQRRVVGSSQKLQNETGWKPGISITKTLQSVLSDWEEREVQE
ncbi:GDP-mannose 4,6-dehydratase [Pseudomonas sp. SO81]|uniref:GDP-mannose 4,6-dehydratase n=1 Tax=Pseudomonas sp. SO81 TaxID=2983246 RepID=UPI0025A432C0|nr:GDP-mannose 4,6-dehydratase [Pseudomonas sp. SO81]WJN59462.1 GDP-mannose 4,6-dehydratase [Pseudomonas sp. SO81]